VIVASDGEEPAISKPSVLLWFDEAGACVRAAENLRRFLRGQPLLQMVDRARGY
jgi:hypothetical protein